MHCFGRCYCQVADGKATAGWLCCSRCYCQWQMEKLQVNYFNFSSEVLNRTSSQTCGPNRYLGSQQDTNEIQVPGLSTRYKRNPKKQDTIKAPTKRTNTNNQKKSHIVVPYYSGLSESIKNIGSKYGVEVYFKGGSTIKNLLMFPKDKDPIQKQSGVIYRYQCDRVDCDKEYIGESSRTFGERFKEHLKPPPIYDHSNITGHNITIINFTIVGREDLNLMRTIKEVLYIRVNDPSLNRNVGKYHLPHVWDEVLLNTSELKLK